MWPRKKRKGDMPTNNYNPPKNFGTTQPTPPPTATAMNPLTWTPSHNEAAFSRSVTHAEARAPSMSEAHVAAGAVAHDYRNAHAGAVFGSMKKITMGPATDISQFNSNAQSTPKT